MSDQATGGVERGRGGPSQGHGGRAPRAKISLKSPLGAPGASVKHCGKEVGRVQSFRLRARSESRSGVAAWFTPEEHFESSTWRSNPKRQCRAVPRGCIVVKWSSLKALWPMKLRECVKGVSHIEGGNK